MMREASTLGISGRGLTVSPGQRHWSLECRAGWRRGILQFFLTPSLAIALRTKGKLKPELLCRIRCFCGDSQDVQCSSHTVTLQATPRLPGCSLHRVTRWSLNSALSFYHIYTALQSQWASASFTLPVASYNSDPWPSHLHREGLVFLLQWSLTEGTQFIIMHQLLKCLSFAPAP